MSVADHSSAIWGYTPTLSGLSRLSVARSLGRRFPAMPDAKNTSATIRPYATTAIPAADTWGVAFPAGSLLVTRSTFIRSSWGGSFNDGLEDFWKNVPNAFGTDRLVPGVLPLGYTPTLYTPWHSGGEGGVFGTAVRIDRQRTAAGYSQPAWQPTSAWNGYSDSWTILDSGISPGIPGPGPDRVRYYKTLGIDNIGYRKIQVQLFIVTVFAPSGGSATIRFSHNADGSSPGADDGNTVDYTNAVTPADVTLVGGVFPSLQYESAWFDAGTITVSSEGTPTIFQGCIEHYAPAGNGMWLGYGGLRLRFSPRVDVPLPCSIPGQGDIIAPGGTV